MESEELDCDFSRLESEESESEDEAYANYDLSELHEEMERLLNNQTKSKAPRYPKIVRESDEDSSFVNDGN